MKKKAIAILRKIVAKKSMQGFFENLFYFSLLGMNYGNSGDFQQSGELNVLKYVKRKLNIKGKYVIFDVGANVGEYAKALSSIFDNAEIHSFEPSSKTFQIFLNTTKGINNIIPNNFGLGEKIETVTLYTNDELSGLASIYERTLLPSSITLANKEEISISTIDHYCKERKIERIHFLKMDIEGNELNALKGAKEMISNNKVEFIQFEFGGCNIDSGTFFKEFFLMLGANYRIYRILQNDLFLIEKYKEINEVFITVNFLAERIQ
jgi:FkbM family methyltransferase